MTQHITIPRTVGAAQRKLAELGELATATEWQRAAIVAAFVAEREGQGRRASVDSDGGLESATAFAGRGIHGLTSATTVLIYARAWLSRFDRPQPGRRVELPTDPWPPTRTGTDGYESEDGADRTVGRLIERHGAEAIATAVAARAPEAVATAAVSSRAGVTATRRALGRHDDETLERSGLGATRDRLNATAAEADGNYRRREFGTDDPDAQAVLGHIRAIVDIDLARGLRGESPAGDYVLALTTLVTTATMLRDRHNGSPTEWTDNDRALLAELGVSV